MTIQRMIELLEIEHECMLRGAHDDCDRNCADCELVQEDDELHEMYTNVIALLKEQETMMQCIKGKCRICPHCVNCDVDENGLLKEQKVRELTMDEWREWKNNPKRNPICKLWEHDTSPMWILNPNDVHEPALLIGKLKLFTGKPTFEQCKEVKWE